MKKLSILMLLCLGFVFLLAACTSSQGANPEEVVNGFLEAFMADDLDRAMSYFADDAVFNAVNAQHESRGKEDVRDHIEFLMSQVIDMETRNFSLDGNQVTWEASLERTSTPTDLSFLAIIEAGKITYLETNRIANDD